MNTGWYGVARCLIAVYVVLLHISGNNTIVQGLLCSNSSIFDNSRCVNGYSDVPYSVVVNSWYIWVAIVGGLILVGIISGLYRRFSVQPPCRCCLTRAYSSNPPVNLTHTTSGLHDSVGNTRVEHGFVTSVNAFSNPGHYFPEPIEYGNLISPPAYPFEKLFTPPPAYSELNFTNQVASIAIDNNSGVYEREGSVSSTVISQPMQAASLTVVDQHDFLEGLNNRETDSEHHINNTDTNIAVTLTTSNLSQEENMKLSQIHTIHNEEISLIQSDVAVAIHISVEVSESTLYEPPTQHSSCTSTDFASLELVNTSSQQEVLETHDLVRPLMTSSATEQDIHNSESN